MSSAGYPNQCPYTEGLTTRHRDRGLVYWRQNQQQGLEMSDTPAFKVERTLKYTEVSYYNEDLQVLYTERLYDDSVEDSSGFIPLSESEIEDLL